jgi:hypothetical protein
MAEKKSRWLMGCGIGCGVVVLIIIIIAAVGYYFVKDTISAFKETEESIKRLEERFGKVQDFCPNADGKIGPDRIQIFLSVRNSMSQIALEMKDSMDKILDDVKSMEKEKEKKSFWDVIGIIKDGFGALPQLAKFYTIRNQSLLEAEMGLGEYFYLYITIYYSWLGKPPEEGPNFNFTDEERNRGGIRIDIKEASEREDQQWEDDDELEERRYRMTRYIRRIILPMIQCQLKNLRQSALSQETTPWEKALEAEIEVMKKTRDYLPWQNGLPEVIKNSLEPYREQLESSYNSMLNPLELAAGGDRR